MEAVTNHLFSPFSFDFPEKGALTREEKVTSVAAAVFTGALTAFFGGPWLLLAGVPAFYAASAYFKNRHIKNWTPPEINNPDRKVHFNVARERHFQAGDDPDKVALLQSDEACNFAKQTGPTREKAKKLLPKHRTLLETIASLFG